MITKLYPKLAWDGIKKNKRLYVPFILTCAGMVMMFYIIFHLASLNALGDMGGGTTIKTVLSFGVWVIAIFALIFLTYTNSFLMRRRQKEFGLFNILGMGKKNLMLVYVWETLFVFAISLASGLVCGIALSKLAELGLVRMLYGEVTYDFTVSPRAIVFSLMVFGVIFVFLFLKGILKLWRLNAISLIKSENVGEKPPKANYILGFGGIVILAAAYYIAVSIESPLLALAWFFVAVVLVIVATYMIFVSGSVMMCRLLQKNKRFYYKKNHFVAISSMAYRMKRNGAGLASICILSTMVLVMMLGSASLYFGAEDSLKSRYPKEISVWVDFNYFDANDKYTPEKKDRVLSEIEKILDKHYVKPLKEECYVGASITGLLQDGKLIVNPNTVNGANTQTMKNVTRMYFISLDEYNLCMGTDEKLEEGEILIYPVRRSYDYPQITLKDGTTLSIKKQVDKMMGSGNAAMDIIPSMFVVANNIEDIVDVVNSEFDSMDYCCRPSLCYGFDTGLDADENIQLSEEINEMLRKLDYTGEGGFYCYMTECREAQRADFYGTYGGIFYLGIVLSFVFVIATVLIIYYKQVTEGYEDESRFAIMQKVGMTKKDIRKSINSQMLMVFFLPLAVAVMHVSFAFPMVQKLLALFNLRNMTLMFGVLAVSILVFGVFYGIVYKATSNAYYSIVTHRRRYEQ